MGALLSEVTAKIRNLVPESIGRWSDAALAVLIHQAEMIVGEQCDSDWTTTDISLLQGALYYPLPKNFIGVGSVTYAENGTDFTDEVLWPCTLRDLDETDRKWRDQVGTKPTHYAFLGAPGGDSSRILLWPALTTVTTQKVRVTHLFSYHLNDSVLAARVMTHEAQNAVYVPLVLGMMYANIDSARANLYFRNAFDAMGSVRAGFTSPYSGGFPSDTAEGVSRLGGQLR